LQLPAFIFSLIGGLLHLQSIQATLQSYWCHYEFCPFVCLSVCLSICPVPSRKESNRQRNQN